MEYPVVSCDQDFGPFGLQSKDIFPFQAAGHPLNNPNLIFILFNLPVL